LTNTSPEISATRVRMPATGVSRPDASSSQALPRSSRSSSDCVRLAASGQLSLAVGTPSSSGSPSGGGATVQTRRAGVASALPYGSRARATNVCGPRASPAYAGAAPHAANGAPSSEHSKAEPATDARSANAAVVLAVTAVGPPAIVVSGWGSPANMRSSSSRK
jgi:hypothetical protein